MNLLNRLNHLETTEETHKNLEVFMGFVWGLSAFSWYKYGSVLMLVTTILDLSDNQEG